MPKALGNQLLNALEAASRKRIDPHLEPIKLNLGDIVCDAGGLLKHAYFPQGAVLSLLTVLENGSAIETANIGQRNRCRRPASSAIVGERSKSSIATVSKKHRASATPL